MANHRNRTEALVVLAKKRQMWVDRGASFLYNEYVATGAKPKQSRQFANKETSQLGRQGDERLFTSSLSLPFFALSFLPATD
jgi:hypothetical protein